MTGRDTTTAREALQVVPRLKCCHGLIADALWNTQCSLQRMVQIKMLLITISVAIIVGNQ
jgi:hypothetical protein